MATFKRNKDAEKFEYVIIPKDTTVLAGIVSVDHKAGTVFAKAEKHAGRPRDEYNVKFQVLAGPYKGVTFKIYIYCHVERRVGCEPDPYGNSRQYCELTEALGFATQEDAYLPDDPRAFARKLVGKTVTMEVGTRKYKDKEGKEREAQTVKSIWAIKDDARETYQMDIATFEATMAATKSGGALDDEDDDDFDFPPAPKS